MSEINEQIIGSGGLLRAIEVAKALSISRAMAYRLMQQGDIRTVRIAGSRRVRIKDLERYISDNMFPPVSPASRQ